MQAAPISIRTRTLACLDRLPRLSPLMMQLIAKLARPMCEFAEITPLITKDPLLAGQVLSIANSALLRRRERVTTVERAVLMIGIGTLRKFALGFSISNLFKSLRPAPSFSMTRFNLHSVGTAMLAEALASEVAGEAVEEAFIAGILHDIGRLLIAVTLPDEFETITSLVAVKETPLVECERSVLEVDHAELSGLAIQRWELGESIERAVRFHHQPEQAPAESGAKASTVSLSLVIHKADAFVNHLGISVLPAPAVALKAPSLDFEGIQYSRETVMETFEREWKTVGDLFR